MAKTSTNSKSTSKRRSTASGTKRSSSGTKRRDNKRTVAKKKSFVRSETAAVLTVAAGFILFLIDLGLLGKVGAGILGFEKGLLGQASFLLAFAVAGAALIGYFEQGSYLRPHKIVSVFAALFVVSGILHLMFGKDALAGNSSTALTAAELYRLGAEGHSGGGLIGGLIANTLKGVIGYAGAYLVLIALLIICAVIITEKSFINIARMGAQKTAGAVRVGAGRTLQAAREGREMYRQHHRESEIRRDARREMEKLRRLEEGFEPLHDGESRMEVFTLDPGPAVRDAEAYADYGREIIGDEQPGLESLEGIAEPVRRPAFTASPAPQDIDYNTQVIRDVFRTEEKKPAAAVRIKQIDYDEDAVPFDEQEEELYRSYAHMLEKGRVNVEAASMAGYAVGRQPASTAPVSTEIREIPESFAAFQMVPADPGEEIPVQPEEKAHINEGFAPEGLVDEAPDSSTLRRELAAEGIEDSFTHSEIRVQETGSEEEDEEPEVSEIPAAGTEYEDVQEPDYEDEEEEEPDTTYLSAYGKEMKTPDSYEARKILESKRQQGKQDSPKTAAAAPVSAAPAAVSAAASAPAQEPARKAAEPAAASQPAAVPQPAPKPKPYVFPPVRLLERSQNSGKGGREEIANKARKLEQVLHDFGVGAKVIGITRGPRVSRFELLPDVGVKVSRITALEGDIKLALAAREIRIEAPIPGKSAVGIEVPNEESQTVKFRDILDSEEFKSAKSKLSWGIGLDIQGKPVVGDISKMPHLLVAGTTGSGKSVGINSLIMSILYRAAPEEVRMILIDPKVVELSVYNGIPHLLTDVVTKPERAVSVLNWAVSEMNNRYKLFETSGTRNIGGYNNKVRSTNEELDRMEAEGAVITENRPQKLPYILIIIDELAELMMHSKKDIEGSIVSLTQLARAAGIHLVVATQRPSVDVITGLIKSNIPSRIAYRLPSMVDSKTILDTGGAETLLGNGDMLYKPGDKNSPERIQGAFLSDNEVEAVVEFLRKNNQQNNDASVEAALARPASSEDGGKGGQESSGPELDEYFANAGRLIITSGKASIGALQRKFKIGFNRAARIMDQLHEFGVVSDGEGTKERQILMTMEEFENIIGS